MSEEVLGIIIAIITSFAFAVWAMPRKLTPESSQTKYIIFYSVGLMVSAGFWSLFFGIEDIHFERDWENICIGFFSGVVISGGFLLFNISIEKNGFSVASAFKNTQPLPAYIFGGIILGEFSSTNPYLVFVGVLLISIVGILLYISSFDEFKKHLKTLMYPLATSAIFAFGMMWQKYIIDLGIVTILFLNGFGFFVTFMLLSFFKKPKKSIDKKGISLAMLSGFLVSLCYIGLFLAYRYLEFSIAYALTNLSTLWIILAGIFIFKELNFKQYKKIIFLSIILLLVAIFSLYLSKVYI